MRCVQGLAGRVLTTGEIVNVVAGQVGLRPSPVVSIVSACGMWRPRCRTARGFDRLPQYTERRCCMRSAVQCRTGCLLCAPLVACRACAALRLHSPARRIADECAERAAGRSLTVHGSVGSAGSAGRVRTRPYRRTARQSQS